MPSDDITTNPTERHMRCPTCTVPRFLGAVSGALEGYLRVPCVKCRVNTIFDLETALPITTLVQLDNERELRCGSCRWFLAGLVVAAGEGKVRIPCVRKGCKRNNSFLARPGATRPGVQVPTG